MKKIYQSLIMLILSSTFLIAQVEQVSYFNSSTIDPADPNRPFFDITNHVRSASIAYDLDNDGKNEILVTDYSNGGRVHVLEYNGTGALELVWSSPVREGISSGSTPRWVKSGDLDGDGLLEIIFSLTNGAADDKIAVYEWDGANDNSFIEMIEFPANLFASMGIGDFRTNREVAYVYDFDGDGRDELITANRDNKVYILGINGDAPGFASWQIEGGDPNVHPNNGFSGGSWWHSIPVDYNGDGTKEIVNHYWNWYGFWSIKPLGPDSYEYPIANPDGGVKGPYYFEYLKDLNEDATSYMGINALDVDGDGNEEIFGVLWIGTSTINYATVLIDVGGAEATGLDVWNSQDQFAILKEKAWLDIGLESGEYWGTGAADLNYNGKDELLLGGVPGNILTTLEYNGEGSIMDGANYTATKYEIFDALPSGYNHYDSAGVNWIDTLYTATQYFISKMDAGDFTDNGKTNVVLAYQTVPDSLDHKFFSWDGNAFAENADAAYKEFNQNAINLRVLEADPSTGVRQLDLAIITPDDYTIEQNYPNPFNPSTTIRFSLPINKEVSLVVYDMLGREVKTLLSNQELNKGFYEITWEGLNNFDQQVASGNYIATLKYGNFSKSIKMSLMK